MAFVWNACGIVRSIPPPAPSSSSGSFQMVKDFQAKTGIASHYGEKDQGNLTASGEPYNHWDFTGSHKSFPFGQYVMVTNLNNNQSVVVRINDRPAQGDNKIIGLSGSAAVQIGLLQTGIAKVEIVPVEPAATAINRTNTITGNVSPNQISNGAVYTTQDPYRVVERSTYPAWNSPASALSPDAYRIPTETTQPLRVTENNLGYATTTSVYSAPTSANPTTKRLSSALGETNQRKSGLFPSGDAPNRANALGGEDVPLPLSSMNTNGITRIGTTGPHQLKRSSYTTPNGDWTIQISAVQNQRSIREQQTYLGKDLWQENTSLDNLIRLNFGLFLSKSDAQQVLAELRELGYNDAFVKPAKRGY